MFQSRKAISKEDECFLVEGYTDVISLHQGGVENVLASSGTSLTEDQLRLISQLTKNLTILYDGDAAGIKAALRGLDMALSQSFNVKLVLLPEGEDPDSFIQNKGASQFHEYVKQHKKDVISFRLEVGLREVGADPIAKSKLVNEIAESISKINKAEDFSLQHYYIKETANKLELDEAALINLVNKYIRERIEQERRTEKRTEKLPEPETFTPAEALPELQTKETDEEQEWELLRVLIVHGGKPFEGFANVADMLLQQVDPELLENINTRKIFDEYQTYVTNTGAIPSENYFVNHPQPELQKLMATLLHNHTDISPNWSKNYGIETLNGDLNYINEAESALSYFELKVILKMQDEITKRLLGEKDERKITVLQQEFWKLRKSESEIVRKRGTTVFKILKK
jgi:DNA primase